jgi:hypothetical protein
MPEDKYILVAVTTEKVWLCSTSNDKKKRMRQYQNWIDNPDCQTVYTAKIEKQGRGGFGQHLDAIGRGEEEVEDRRLPRFRNQKGQANGATSSS